MSWYALLAYRELGRTMPPLANESDVNAAAKPLSADSAFSTNEKLTLAWLLAVGEDELARKYLDQIASRHRSDFSENQMLDLLEAYGRSGHYQALFSRLNELSAEKRASILDKNPALLFPQPWSALVQNASDKFGVQRELIYAIMRQESSFNPLARSGADAFGLLQLIPEMAKRAEITAHLPIASHDELFEPEINIPLGAAFLHDLFLKWDDHFIPSVASYNASEKAVSRWLKSRYHGDVLTFIEDVPYEETRTYIKLVMRNYIFYKRLNSGGAAAAFPEWCLANLHEAKP